MGETPDPNHQLLYLCSLSDGKGIDQESFVSLISEIKDWDRLLKTASHHRLQPRLYFFLKNQGAASFLEPRTWARIEAAHLWAQAHVLAHEGELGILLPLLNKAGIDVLLLKGAALLRTVYRNRPLRFLVDLDLLIHREDLPRTEALLRNLGYEPHLDHLPSQWHERELYSGPNRAHFPFVHPQRKINLDLHVEAFDLPSPFHLGADWLWEKARPDSSAGGRIFLPHPNRLFLHLLFHLVQHSESEPAALGWVADLDECLHHFAGEINGSYCGQIIRTNPEADKLLEILALLDRDYASPLPPALKAILPKLASFDHHEGRARYEQFLSHWSRVSGLRKKTWFLLRWFLPDRQYLEAKYPYRSLPQKAAAHLKHFAVTLWKGAGLSIYMIDRRLSLKYNSPSPRKEEENAEVKPF